MCKLEDLAANCKSYSLYSVHKDGQPDWYLQDFEGVDVVSYICQNHDPEEEFKTWEEALAHVK